MGIEAAATFAAELPSKPTDRPPREIYVPFSDLHILLDQQPKRVLLGREEYNALLAKAKKTPETHSPHPAAILSADFTIDIAAQGAELSGTLLVEVLEDGLHALPLDIGSVGLAAAVLDNRAAAVGRGDDGQLRLFVEGKGRHALKLRMHAALQTTAAQQVLNFRLPRPAIATMRLNAPGDVEIKGGATVVRRTVDDSPRMTHFELLPSEGDMSLLLTLNSHLESQKQAVVARSVFMHEVTEACEKLHATVSLNILYRAIDQFRMGVPAGFEILDVNSPLLARWDVQSQDGQSVLTIRLREQTTDPVVLKILAVRNASGLGKWSVPRLTPLDVVGQVAVVGLLVNDRLQAESLATEGLIPIDTATLQQEQLPAAQPASSDAQSLRTVAAWYAPQGQFAATAEFKKPPAELAVAANLLLRVSDKGHELVGGLALTPRVEKRFAFDLTMPAGWKMLSVTTADDKPLPFECHEAKDGGVGRVRIATPGGISIGEEYNVKFNAARTPPDWLADWQTAPVDFPAFSVADATQQTGAIAVEVQDDMTVRPDKLERLIPIDAAEKAKYGFKDAATTLAYQFDASDYRASLVMERTQPRLTARTFSFLRLEPDALNCHYELIYTVDEARTQRLALTLPDDTPASLSITALDGVKLKEFNSETAEKTRRWNVLLAEPRRGKVRLAIDFRQPLVSQEGKSLGLPIVAAEGVEYQSGLAAVEGCAELDVQVDTAASRVDVGELADAEYQPGRRLLGAYGFVGTSPGVKINVVRHPAYPIYPAIVESCVLDTNLSPQGVSQTQARFGLRTKATYLQIKLPAEAELWAAEIDGSPLKPQRDGDSVLIGLPAGKEQASQWLQITYSVPVGAIALRGTVDVPAPKLFFRSEGEADAVEVPLANVVWRLHLPTGYDVVRTGGTLSAEDLCRPTPAIVDFAGLLYGLTGRIGEYGLQNMRDANLMPLGCGGRPARFSAPKSAAVGSGSIAPNSKQAEPYYLSDDVQYGPPAAATPADMSPVATLSEPPDISIGDGEKAEAIPAFGFRAGGKPAKEPSYTIAKPKWSTDRASQMLGVRSLKIDVVQSPGDTDRAVSFNSLGVEPRLEVTLINRTHWSALSWALALAVGLVGLMLTRRAAWTKAGFIFGVMLFASLWPLLFTSVEWASFCNQLFFAAAWLVPYYLVIAVVRWFVGEVRRLRLRHATKVASVPAVPMTPAVLVFALLLVGSALADPPANKADKPDKSDGRYVVQVVEPPAPVVVPNDAIILPYDPESSIGVKSVDRLLVPYEQYVELWNRAYPDKPINTKPLPAAYALAGVSYKSLLQGEEYLLLAGQMEIDVFGDDFVQIPLGLGGGVLAQAELDGKPARLSVVEARPLAANAPNPPAQQAAVPQAAAKQAKPKTAAGPAKDADRSILMLHVSGKGRHRLDLSVRLKLARQGGWRVVEGVIPAAPATSLAMTVPQAQTEVRLGRGENRRSWETTKPDEPIQTALDQDGSLSLQWRAKVAEGQVDTSLTAASNAVFDVQEDGLRLTWRFALDFRRSQREQFSLLAPKDYLVEKVEGGNVRGWEVRNADNGQTVEISLLKPAKDREEFTVRLWRAGAVGQKDLAEFTMPIVGVADAALHNGQLTIRRSPLIDLRVLDRTGVSRTDLPAVANVAAPTDESPLGIRPFQAYRFATTPFALRLAASPMAANVSATVQSLVRMGETERSMESRVMLNVKDRPIHQIEMFLPPDMTLDHVSAPGEFQYAVTRRDDRPLLTIYLAAGQQGNVPVVLRGKLHREKPAEQALPRLEVLGVERQQGDIAVQTDPAFDVDAVDLAHCNKIELLSKLYGWLSEEQRRLTRLGLHYDGGDYAATIRLAPRTPDVVCDTITNVRVTNRTVETTILLDFTIRNAGVRSVTFRLPEDMAGSRINVPMLRQKKTEKIAAEGGELQLRVTLELQDEVMDQLRVLIENDRLLTPGSHSVPIPAVELGRTNRRFAAIERSGRDEIVIDEDKRSEMDVLGRQQKEWDLLKGILGREMTLAYLVGTDARQPRLAFHTETGTAVQTVDARIGLAETTLVFDANGAYRAQQVYRIDNRTEQFLEIELPLGAELWTTRVADESIKPTRASKTVDARRVQIPLIKTAPGELDYEVVLKYGGKMPRLGMFDEVEFPMVHSINIQPELSQVKLYVPENHRWFDFGGTMRQVGSDADLLAGYVGYQTEQTTRIMKTLQSGDAFARVRAATNLKAMRGLGYSNSYDGRAASQESDAKLQTKLNENAQVVQQAEQEAAKVENAPAQTEVMDNRYRLGELFQSQSSGRAKNVLNDLNANWDMEAQSKESGKKGWAKTTERSQSAKRGADAAGSEKSELKLEIQAKPNARGDQEGEAVARYKDRLDRQSVQQAPAQNAPRRSGKPTGGKGQAAGMGGGMGLGGRMGGASNVQERGQLGGFGYEKKDDEKPDADKLQEGSPEERHAVDPYSTEPSDDKMLGRVPFAGGVPSDAGLAGDASAPPPSAEAEAAKEPAVASPAAPAMAAGLASLDFELPTRGMLYRFVMPRGKVQITAKTVPNDLIERLKQLAGVAIAVAVAWYAGKLLRAGRLAWLISRSFATLWICLGILSICFGILPILGIVVFATGCTLKFRRKAA